MRVIAGSARRTPLAAPKGHSTRPTADRVKESLFNILAPHVPGARFLDLFCGSGAIGIEALSRGASEVVFADNSRDAISALAANLERTRLSGRVMLMNALAAVSALEQEGRGFDIIFLDPPYGQGLLSQTLIALGESDILLPGCIVVAECDKNESAPDAGKLELHDTREYGGTRLLFYQLGHGCRKRPGPRFGHSVKGYSALDLPGFCQ